jgi:hypothetical protein
MSDSTHSPLDIFLLLFRNIDGRNYPVEIAAATKDEAIAFIEKRDGSTFVTVINPR